MLKSLVRTIRGPSRDPRMEYISRPLPRGLTEEDALAAVALALEASPNPAHLVETLPAALREVTGRDLQVLDRSVWDVTGAFGKTMVMVRDGEVGLWPGYAARAYPLLDRSGRADDARRAIAAASGDGDSEGAASPATNPVGKAGWAPPGPHLPDPEPVIPIGDAEAGASGVQGTISDEPR